MDEALKEIEFREMKGLKKIIFGILQRILQIYLSNLKNSGYVFMFHEVSSRCRTQSAFWISLQGFERFLEIIGGGDTFASIEDFGTAGEKKRVYITFDDVYEEFYLYAYPILKAKQIPFLVFITTEYIGKPGYLSEAMITELAKEPLCTIGSHLEHHIMARGLTSVSLKKELEDSRLAIENMTGKKVRTLAFPYGSCMAMSFQNIRLAKQYYDLVFTTWSSHFNIRWVFKNRVLPRVNINEETLRRYLNENAVS